MFRRYFQMGDEEDQEGSSGDDEAEQAEQVPPPEEVWAQVGWVGDQPQQAVPVFTLSRAAYGLCWHRLQQWK